LSFIEIHLFFFVSIDISLICFCQYRGLFLFHVQLINDFKNKLVFFFFYLVYAFFIIFGRHSQVECMSVNDVNY